MRRVKLTVAYDGTEYRGWQIQKNDPMTIEGQLLEALQTLMPREAATLQLIGASRTDAGVHACGNVAVFDTESTIPTKNFPVALNGKLPEDIRVMKAEDVPETFHPRHVQHEKHYCYSIDNRRIPDPLVRRFHYNYTYPLRIDRICRAAAHMLGVHDFTSFVNPDSQVFEHGGDAVREVYSIDITARYRDDAGGIKTARFSAGNAEPMASIWSEARQYEEVKIDITGSGFLYHQIRIMVGTLLQVGIGKIEPEGIEKILAAKDRTKAGPTVPANGLCLMELDYGDNALTENLHGE